MTLPRQPVRSFLFRICPFKTHTHKTHTPKPCACQTHYRRDGQKRTGSPARVSGRAAGMTVTELLVALTIIGVAFTALAMAQVTSLQVTRSSSDAATARDAAQQKLELIRAFGYAAFRTCPGTQSALSGAPSCAGTEVLASNDRFTVSWNVDSNPFGRNQSGQAPALVEARVTVTWHEQSYELVAFLSCADVDAYSTLHVACSGVTKAP
jgi:Tfp pilus assembly protein PilV